MSNSNTLEVTVDYKGIDTISEFISNWMTECKTDKYELIRTRLTVEELLLSVNAHYEKEVSATVYTGTKFGKRYCRIVYDGESFDPFAKDENLDEWTEHLISSSETVPSWSFSGGKNELYFTLSKRVIKTESLLVGSVILAILFGLIKVDYSGDIIDFASEKILTPLSDVFINLLNTFAVLLIFFSVLSGICGLGGARDFSKMGKTIINRFLVRSAFFIAISIGILYLIYRLPYGETQGSSQSDELIKRIFAIIPSDPLSPFINGDMLQIVFMAIIIGIVILANKHRLRHTTSLLIELNDISTRTVELVCKLLPLYIFVTLTLLFWQNGMGIFFRIWKPLLIYTSISFFIVILSMLIVSIKFKVSLKVLAKKIRPTFIIGLTTASSTVAFSKVLDTNERKLGISPDVSKFGVPIGNLLCSATTGASMASIVFYLTDYYGLSINVGWFIMLWLMCFIFAISLPPVSGALLICLGIIMKNFNIPSEGLAIAGTMGLIFDFIDTSSRIVISHMELCLSADKLGKLNKEKLRKP